MADEIRTTEVIAAELSRIEEVTATPESEDAVKGPSQAAVDASEYEAGRKGWVPKAQYKKDAPWVDAQTFLERGDRFVNNLQRDVATLTKKLEDFEGTKAAFVKFSEDALAKKDVELKSAISALRVQRTQAIREGEDDLAVELEDRIDLLREQSVKVKELPAVVAAPGPKTEDPVLKEWIDDGNAWFNEDANLRDFAVKMGEKLIANGETVRGRRFLDKIRTIMVQEFPRRFGKKDDAAARTGAESSTAASGNRSGGVAGKTARDLPKEDLALMKEFIATGYTTEAKFLQSYFSR